MPTLEPGDSERLERHLSECLRCQAEAARYGSLSRQLARLGSTVVAAPDGLARAVIHAVGDAPADAERAPRSKAPTAAAAAGATLAAASAVAVYRWLRVRIASM